MLTVLLTGCGPGAPAPRERPAPPAPHSAAPAGHTGDTGSAPETPPDPRALGGALQAALDLLPLLSVDACRARYDELLRAADPRCPTWFQLGDPASWDDACVAASGAEFRGFLTSWDGVASYVDEQLFDDVLAPEGPLVAPGWTPGPAWSGSVRGDGLDGSARIALGDRQWRFAGEGFQVGGADGDLRFVHHRLRGTCADAEALGSPWTDRGLDTWLDLTELRGPTDAPRTRVDGTLAGLGGAFDAVTFVDVVLAGPAAGGSCAAAPTGTIEVRGADGARWALDFGGACDGCAALPGAGPVCVDFSPLAALAPVAP